MSHHNKMVDKVQPSVINDHKYTLFERCGGSRNHLLIPKLAHHTLGENGVVSTSQVVYSMAMGLNGLLG